MDEGKKKKTNSQRTKERERVKEKRSVSEAQSDRDPFVNCHPKRSKGAGRMERTCRYLNRQLMTASKKKSYIKKEEMKDMATTFYYCRRRSSCAWDAIYIVYQAHQPHRDAAQYNTTATAAALCFARVSMELIRHSIYSIDGRHFTSRKAHHLDCTCVLCYGVESRGKKKNHGTGLETAEHSIFVGLPRHI